MTDPLTQLQHRLAEVRRRRAATLLIAGVAGLALTAGLPWQHRDSAAGPAWTELTVALPWSWPLIAVASVAAVLVLTGRAVRVGAVLCGVAGVVIAAAATHAVHSSTARGWQRSPFEVGAGSWTGFVAGVLLVAGAVAVWRHPSDLDDDAGPRFERRRPTLTDEIRELRRAAMRIEGAASTSAPSHGGAPPATPATPTPDGDPPASDGVPPPSAPHGGEGQH